MVWDSLLVMKPGCAGGRGFAPRPGQYSSESFSSNQETGKVFSRGGGTHIYVQYRYVPR